MERSAKIDAPFAHLTRGTKFFISPLWVLYELYILTLGIFQINRAKSRRLQPAFFGPKQLCLIVCRILFG